MTLFPHIPLHMAKPDANRFVGILRGTVAAKRVPLIEYIIDDVRARVRELICTCSPAGRYAVGSGNSIPSYVPINNYLAMIDEAHAMDLP